MGNRASAKRQVAGLLAAVLSLAVTHTAAASKGVAIDLGRIEIEQKLTPGGSYRLPLMGVRNPGTEATMYELKASPVEVDGRKAPPAGWFHFSPAKLMLKPKETRSVKVRLELPTGADPGDYIALVGPQIATNGSGAQVGAAAASRVTFSVEPATTLGAYWLKVKTFFSDHALWSYVVPLVLLLALLAYRIRSRFAFRIERRA
jgi:hypothetical protein